MYYNVTLNTFLLLWLLQSFIKKQSRCTNSADIGTKFTQDDRKSLRVPFGLCPKGNVVRRMTVLSVYYSPPTKKNRWMFITGTLHHQAQNVLRQSIKMRMSLESCARRYT